MLVLQHHDDKSIWVAFREKSFGSHTQLYLQNWTKLNWIGQSPWVLKELQRSCLSLFCGYTLPSLANADCCAYPEKIPSVMAELQWKQCSIWLLLFFSNIIQPELFLHGRSIFTARDNCAVVGLLERVQAIFSSSILCFVSIRIWFGKTKRKYVNKIWTWEDNLEAERKREGLGFTAHIESFAFYIKCMYFLYK